MNVRREKHGESVSLVQKFYPSSFGPPDYNNERRTAEMHDYNFVSFTRKLDLTGIIKKKKPLPFCFILLGVNFGVPHSSDISGGGLLSEDSCCNKLSSVSNV
ncbi:hypothetical protein ACH5RR_011597 [Cinchona calisaya]|uniref:Uncharacterized protein n=1 Tax=Cinchona calisaya TaxID=153742 RepID=A0ABD3A5C6_9GENT